MNYLDEDNYESIIKKLEDCKIQIEDNWDSINGHSIEMIEDAWQGADSRAFVDKLKSTQEYVDEINSKIDKTIEYFKKYIEIINKEKAEKQNGSNETERN